MGLLPLKILGVHWCRACQYISSEVNSNLLYSAPPATKKRDTMSSWPLDFGGNNILIRVYYSGPFTACFEWGPEQEKALPQVQSAVQASLTLGFSRSNGTYRIQQVQWNLKCQ